MLNMTRGKDPELVTWRKIVELFLFDEEFIKEANRNEKHLK